LITDFYINGKLPTSLSATEIVLIPKKTHANLVTDFRPISLTNVTYRPIAKSLANMLEEELPDYIHQS
jgi:hypothetical protein